jgi:hypothetical protein
MLSSTSEQQHGTDSQKSLLLYTADAALVHVCCKTNSSSMAYSTLMI